MIVFTVCVYNIFFVIFFFMTYVQEEDEGV